MPHGLHGVWMAVLRGDALVQRHRGDRGHLRRSRRTRAAIPAALRTMAVRLFLFYILALTIVVALRALDGDRRARS